MLNMGENLNKDNIEPIEEPKESKEAVKKDAKGLWDSIRFRNKFPGLRRQGIFYFPAVQLPWRPIVRGLLQEWIQGIR